MNFDLTEDQEALRDGIRSLCTGRFGMERVRAGFDGSMFSELDATGVFSLRADGFGWADAGIAFSELGRALVPGPLVWSHLAHGVVDGVVTGVEETAGSGPIAIEHLDAADSIVVATADGPRRVEPSACEGVRAVEWPLDPLTPVHLVDALPPGEAVGDADDARTWRRGGAVLTSAYQVGMAAACVESATAYALDRRQFDRPIGSFQAVKHILADMVVRAELARAAVDAAAVTLDDPAVGDVDRAISGARILATEAALENAKDSMQVHGGMGFTWEVDVHLYLKRAWMLNTTFGTAAAHADALAAGLGR
ncbi:MAG TPA: acyl-CoA dehydrogenase [Acidimicrobiia bacterium]|nr:acyl-CoA dehydrogenase [Acidimicrobiia bacterium]